MADIGAGVIVLSPRPIRACLLGVLALGGALAGPAEAGSGVDEFFRLDADSERNPLSIQPYHRSYFLFSHVDGSFVGDGGTEISNQVANRLQPEEIKFRLSFRVPVAENFLGSGGELYGAYTSLAVWQAFNQDLSSPFRDINHEPELFLAWRTDRQWGPVRLRGYTAGINHQSNGQTHRALLDDDGQVIYSNLSRSWNRLMGSVYFQRSDWLCRLLLWYRLPEKAKTGPDDPQGDDNPDLVDYVGDGELSLYRRFDRHTVTLTARNRIAFDPDRGSLQLDYSFPMTRKLDGIVHVFHGHGENLLDYRSRVTRVGIGFALRGGF